MQTAEPLSKMSGIVQAKCPRCRQGNMFKYGPLAYAHFTQMHDACPVCGQNFYPEPGFYQIAMYASYGFTTAILLICFALVYWLGHNPDAWVYMAYTISTTLLLAPLNYRYSRVSMLYIFGGIRYDPAVASGTL